jgi:hypothetical protein
MTDKPSSECTAGPRELKDPTSKAYALQTLRALRRYLESATLDEELVREELQRIEKYKHWKVLGYANKKEMFQKEGLQSRLQKIKLRAKRLEGKTINAADNHDGANIGGDIITSNSTNKGTSADYLTARLKRDYAEIFQRLLQGEFSSVRKAAIAAGIVKVPGRVEQLLKLWKKATKQEQTEFMKQKDDQ